MFQFKRILYKNGYYADFLERVKYECQNDNKIMYFRLVKHKLCKVIVE